MAQWLRTATVLLLAGGTAHAIWAYWPAQPERYTEPTRLSFLIQKYTPWLYKPQGAVFASRYGGAGPEPAAVLGPDCQRIVIGDLQRINQHGLGAIRTRHCDVHLDYTKLAELLSARKVGSPQDYSYAKLSKTEVETLRFSLGPGEALDTSAPKMRTVIARGGWGPTESWGMWSIGNRASLAIPVKAEAFGVEITLTFVANSLVQGQTAQVSVNGRDLGEIRLERQPSEHSIRVPRSLISGDTFNVDLFIPRPVAPSEVIPGNGDNRPLGVGLRRVLVNG